MSDEDVIELVNMFSDDYLNDEFRQFCLKLVSKLSQNPDISLNRGKAEGWAAGVIYVIGQLNFLFDPITEYYIPNDLVASYFGVSKQTLWNRARDIRRLLNLKLGDEEFSCEYVLNLRIPQSDDDLKRIRTFNEVKHQILPRYPIDIDYVKNRELVNLIRNGADDLNELYYHMRPAYLIDLSHDFTTLMIEKDDGKFVIPLFTSVKESDEFLADFDEELEARYWPFTNVLYRMGNSDFEGVMINPTIDDFFISKEMIKEIYPNPNIIDYWRIYF
ncbi:DUF6398 domain-containing protein [uncultured Methanobrevibacter sp.]|uniref:DUF6398 domain-containing protein n=1 Tax=uncultured Methanobrevibacter sp. TaxID=253161 RepID=UPI002614C4E3|nr:DUF6398 domain-containing protein [uncultured Methanobrevibacter sp.]